MFTQYTQVKKLALALALGLDILSAGNNTNKNPYFAPSIQLFFFFFCIFQYVQRDMKNLTEPIEPTLAFQYRNEMK